jgi:hypothetical protein
VALAEAEFQVLKQELLLQQLIDTGESTGQASALLERLRSVVRQLTERGPSLEISAALMMKAVKEAQHAKTLLRLIVSFGLC